jgi:hypothetical protein
MNIFVTGEDGEVIAINADHIVHAKFNEKRRALSLAFIGGSSLELSGINATEVWKNLYETEDEDHEELDEKELEDIEKMVTALENDVIRNRVDSFWDIQRIGESIDFLPENIPEELLTRTSKLKDHAKAVIAKAIASYYTKEINECNATRIATAASINSILRKLDGIEDALSEGDAITDVLLKKIREAKERVALFRAKKKLDESSVAEAGGSSKKANKLTAEAAEILKQDWLMVFPGESTPPISEIGRNK